MRTLLLVLLMVCGFTHTPSWAQEQKADPRMADIVMGKDDAPVTMIEYASLTCSHCAAFHT